MSGGEGGAAGGSRGRAAPRPNKSRNNTNVPQEIVTPTRRDIRETNISSNIDWLSVSEYNGRPAQGRARKPINALPENNEFIELDSNATPESGNRFVPVRPQPRTLGLKHRENIVENQDETSYNAFLSGLSPHSSHTAVMVVNPTTPNSNLSNQNMSAVNCQSNGTRGHSRSATNNRDGNAMFVSNTVPVGPYPLSNNNKSNNLSQDNQESLYQNGVSQNASNNGLSSENSTTRSRTTRTLGDNLVSSCPDTSRVEQRLGQIQEYIQVTANLVENMRNSEDELRKRIASLRRSNQLLMEGVYQEYDQEHNSEIDELVQTLNDLKDSEAKLKEMLKSVLKISENADSLHNELKACEASDSAASEQDAFQEKNDSPDNNDTVTITEMPENHKIVDDNQSLIQNESDNQDVPRSCSVQSGTSMYSDNYSWQAELEAKMEASQMQIAAALQEQKYILKCQAEAKEQLLAEIGNSKQENHDNLHNNDANTHHESIGHINFNPQQASTSRIYGSNQIGVATTLPHVSDGVRSRGSSSRDREIMDGLSQDFPESRSKRSSSSVPISDLSQLDMLRDLQIRRQHIENQVAKIQNLQVATASLSEAVAESQSELFSPDNNRGQSNWEGSEDSIADDDGTLALNSLRSKMAAVNVVKMELEKLKSMLRTVDSIQNSFGLNPNGGDDENGFEPNGQLSDNQFENQNRTEQSRLSEPSFNNSAAYKAEAVLPGNPAPINQPNMQILKNQNSSHGLCRLQNCISTSSNKCTNVNDQQQHRDSIGSDLASIQQLTQQMKQEAQEINEQRLRLRHSLNRDVNSSSRSSIKSDDKKRTNSMSNYPSSVGPMERKQLVLKAELEAKKKQLERLMSKEVDHRTNQQSSHLEGENSTKSSGSSNDKDNMIDGSCPLPIPHPQGSHSTHSGEDDVYTSHIRSEADNGYSSDPDEDMYSPSSHTQHNINQLNERVSHNTPSQNSSPENFKVNYGDSAQSMEGTAKLAKCGTTHLFGTSVHGKQRNKVLSHNTGPEVPMVPELSNLPRRPSKDTFSSKRILTDNQENNNSPDPCHNQRDDSQDRECNLLPNNQPLADCLVNLPANTNPLLQQRKQPLMREPNLLINNQVNLAEPCSRPDSGSSSGEQELNNIPHPMPTLSLRHSTIKNDQEPPNAEIESQQWHNPHSESQVTMWWHNKANQLQQQLEMTSNLCQSLLQDRHTSQSSLSTLNSLPQTVGNPNFLMPNQPTAPIMPINFGNAWGGVNDQLSGSWWTVMQQQQLALQQQQLAAQQQQLASNSWNNSQCLQNLLSQQREISSLKNTICNLEQKFLNMNVARSHSTPPNMNSGENVSDNQAGRSNSALSRSQYQWSSPNSGNVGINHAEMNPYALWHHNSNLHQDKVSKKGTSAPTYPIDFMNNIPINVPPPFVNDQMNSYINMQHVIPNNYCVGNQPVTVFNNPIAQMHLSSNMQNNQSIQQQMPNNINPNPLLNLSAHVTIPNTHPINMHPISTVATQTLAGHNTALNNQVPPGNRANNYWDNFRSYSRQNLLSGSNKVNAETSFQAHSPHPLAERSHNTLHTSVTPAFSIQSMNTPKRNINNQLGNVNQLHHNPNLQIDNAVENIVRSRRNLSNEITHVPPDVLNVNQNLDSTNPSVLPDASNSEADLRYDDSINVNLNKPPTNMSQLMMQNSNINLSRCNGALKRKSSTKLPAKNATNSGKYSQEYLQNRNVHPATLEPEGPDSNLAPVSSTNIQKSKSKLFDLLRDNVYSEVSALISANESRPHFLIQLFRDLQQISSDPLRQRTLQSIQELVTRYLSNTDPESYGAYEHKTNQRVTSTSGDQTLGGASSTNDLGVFSLDPNNEIVKFMFAHNDINCTEELLKSLKAVILHTAGDSIEEIHLDRCLHACLTKYLGFKLVDIGDELIIALSRIPIVKPTTKHNAIDESNDRACGIEKIQEHENESLFSSAIESAQSDSQRGPEFPSCSTSTNRDLSGEGAVGCSHSNPSDMKIDLIENVESCNGDLAEADQSRDETATSSAGGAVFDGSLPDIVDMDEQTPTEAEAEWLRMDRAASRSDTEAHPANQKDAK